MIINLFENLVVYQDKLTRAQPKECRKYLRKIKKKKKTYTCTNQNYTSPKPPVISLFILMV